MTVLDATDADIRAAAFQHIRRLQEVQCTIILTPST